MDTDPSPCSRRLHAACLSAERMLAFAAGSSRQAPDGLVEAVVRSIDKVRRRPDDVEAQVAFWSAYNRIAAWIAPVTDDSLAYAEPPPASLRPADSGIGSWFAPLAGGSADSPAEALFRRIRRRTLLFLVILIGSQIIWLSGFTTLRTAHALKAEADALLEQVSRIQSAGETLAPDHPVLLPLVTRQDVLRTRIDAVYAQLADWNRAWNLPGHFQNAIITATGPLRSRDTDAPNSQATGSFPAQASPDVGAWSRTLLTAEITVEVLALYVLPLFYGIVGACTAALRSLGRKREARTVDRGTEAGINIRITLGAVAGPVIGLFFQAGQGDGTLAAVSPFALAFLAGYSVDLLFAILDRQIRRFKAEPARPSGPERDRDTDPDNTDSQDGNDATGPEAGNNRTSPGAAQPAAGRRAGERTAPAMPETAS